MCCDRPQRRAPNFLGSPCWLACIRCSASCRSERIRAVARVLAVAGARRSRGLGGGRGTRRALDWLLVLVLLSFVAARAARRRPRLRASAPVPGDLRGPAGLRALQAATGIDRAVASCSTTWSRSGVLDGGAAHRRAHALRAVMERPRQAARARDLPDRHGRGLPTPRPRPVPRRGHVAARAQRSEPCLSGAFRPARSVWRVLPDAAGAVAHFAIGTSLLAR